MTRRRLLGWVGAGSATGLLAGVGSGARPESADAPRTGSDANSLTVDGRYHDGAADYSFGVSGTVRVAGGAGGRTTGGRVYGWRDRYEFDGDVESLALDGAADVRVNGRRVDPDAFDDPADADESGNTTVVEAVAAGGDDASLVELVDVQRAVDWWEAGSAIPGTDGETLPIGRLQRMVDRWSTGTPVGPADDDRPPTLRKLGQTMLSGRADGAGYAEAQLRADGRYAVVGTKFGAHGTYLVDLSDPADPREVHYESGRAGVPNPDVKFDHRDGLYYRTVQGRGDFDIVDYGYATGTPSDPAVSRVFGGTSHNLWPHPETAVLYTVNYDDDPGTKGFDVWDTSDPTDPRKLRSVGPSGACHDVTVDTERDLIHACYQGNDFEGYVVLDAADPRRPTELGRFDYTRHRGYSAVGEEGFDAAHHAEADPTRDLVVLGDERSYGFPGGKHVFDIGWGDGSPSDPRPVGFVTSPNARRMRWNGDGDSTERWDWTGHHFDFLPRDDRTLLVSGDWHEGVVLYDVTDPTAPRAVDRYATDDRANEVDANPTLAQYGDPPWCWNAEYTPGRNLVVAGDQFTGVYTFRV